MKVLAVASAGGHWIQLLRLKTAFKDHELIFVSTKENQAETVKGYAFYAVPDANRWNKFQLLVVFFKISRLIASIKPDVIVTTGAAPGLLALAYGKLRGIKTIWVDSIANVDELSMSGKLARKFSDRIYTQWPHLADEKVIFSGNIIK
jgi:UDP-N-acetylglucosamine:LPS N-acetylglucosamine transferase